MLGPTEATRRATISTSVGLIATTPVMTSSMGGARTVQVTRLALIGTGLIGASIGLAAKERGAAAAVAGWDLDERALAVAVERGAVDEPAGSLSEAVREADLAVVATPIAELPRQVAATIAATGARCTVTDVGSTKAAACAAAQNSERFVGGHPICGSEASGPEHASADLFKGAAWFLTPTTKTEPDRYRRVHVFVSRLGATPAAVDPLAHDRLVALTSHLPHALANVLVNQAAATRVEGYEPLSIAGGSLRDMTRVAGANPRIWIDIFLENADSIREALAETRRRLEQVEAALVREDAGFLARWIGEAAHNRRRLLEGVYPDPGALQQIRVHVSDRPGVLAGITQALSAHRINIEDFDIQHLSPERGTLNLLVSGEREARRAADLLETQGYSPVVAPAVLDDGLE